MNDDRWKIGQTGKTSYARYLDSHSSLSYGEWVDAGMPDRISTWGCRTPAPAAEVVNREPEPAPEPTYTRYARIAEGSGNDR